MSTTPITTAALAQQLAVLIAQHQAGRLSVDQLNAGLVTLFNSWTNGGVTDVQLAAALSQALGNWNTFVSAQLAWLTIGATAGPHANGTIDLVDYLGNVTTIPGLQLLQQQMSADAATSAAAGLAAAATTAAEAAATEVATDTSAIVLAALTWKMTAANYTAVARDQLLLNSTGGSFAVALPTTPSIGDSVRMRDVARMCAVNPVTVGHNGNPIDDGQGVALAGDLTVRIKGVDLVLIWTGSLWWQDAVNASGGSTDFAQPGNSERLRL
jgi:hypothetical protein